MEYRQNTLERQQSRLVVIKAKQLDEGQFEAVLSTDDLDRHGERVSIKGLIIPKNQVIKMYYNHQTYGDHLPIGTWVKIWKTKEGKLMGRGEFDLEDDFAVKVYKKVLKGIIDSISIGFYPQEFDGEQMLWTKSELVEASVVAEPANVNAVVTSKELGFTPEEFTQSLKIRLKDVANSSEPPATPPIPDEPEDDDAITKAVNILANRMGAVEQALKEATECPTKKKQIRLRVALKQVDHAAEQANRVLRVKLNGE